MLNRPAAAIALAVTLAASTGLAACGSSGSDSSKPDTTKPKTTTTAAAVDELEILVANDDGYSAEGIDTLVQALDGVDGVKVTVVAPLTQQSGTGGKSTEGDLKVTDVKTKSGYPAKAVDGYPSDAVRVAIDDLGIEPDVVITGINEGQNVGPLVDVSGTVGAARAAVARGVPALATSQGTGTTFDYAAAVPFILDWLEQNREALATGTADVGVTSLNVPSCDPGEVRGILEVEVGKDGNGALGAQDCESTVDGATLTTDVEAFLNGYAAIGPVPDQPAS